MSNYPQHEIMRQRRDDLDVVGNFLEWLEDRNVELVVWECDTHTEEERLCHAAIPDQHRRFITFAEQRNALANEDDQIDVPPHPMDCRCNGSGIVKKTRIVNEGYVPAFPRGWDRLLAEYIGVDYRAFQDEKEQMYESLKP